LLDRCASVTVVKDDAMDVAEEVPRIRQLRVSRIVALGITRVGRNEVPVAITAIVPVEVTAANGSIHPGDLLTSSNLPGRAMNAGRSPAIGTVLGKALGVLEHGNRTIRMLVRLR